MSVADGTPPRSGRLIHLTTRAELEAANTLIDVYIAEIPTKSASAVINALKKLPTRDDEPNLQHLRRFAKPSFLPLHLQPQPSNTAPHSSSRSSSSSSSDDNASPAASPAAEPTSFLLIAPTSSTTPSDLATLLSAALPPDPPLPPRLMTIPVPLYAPTSLEQAKEWSEKYWPTVFKSMNPHGPHPALVARAESEMLGEGGGDDGVEKWMALARRAAAGVGEKGVAVGEAVGCVIVGREKRGEGDVVAVAGDARWLGQGFGFGDNGWAGECGEEKRRGQGNVMAHAVMRAVGMVARKRVGLAGGQIVYDEAVAGAAKREDAFADLPLTDVEAEAFTLDTLNSNGYLCTDLEIYVTHEPCLMCSMAILHSRFARCIFGQRMASTGAMMADSGLGYGLFWRPELNWKFLCWRWQEDDNVDREETLDNALQV
ncbi:hypothetical protein LTS18_008787 [Coniosporium uncinatum]|uniref:Uncharacterized protein n=1 Tax=Coniosporium uncinatum TaxID=93489 RepID=A0ACC3DN06_9PEZI|nr:hypothetical protein LTS18_008787 [Coniosporium uncinatum]